jgi:hypothetical protein
MSDEGITVSTPELREAQDEESGNFNMGDASLARMLAKLVERFGAEETQRILYKVAPDLAPVTVDVPKFEWNTAHDWMSKRGAADTTVLGLSLISEQLNEIIRKLS